MTVSDQTNRISARGAGAVLNIPYAFPTTASGDLKVIMREILTGDPTEFTEGAESEGYTATYGSGGGSVTTSDSIAATHQVHVIRNTDMTQTLDLVQGGSFNAENIETALDKSVRLIIENSNSLDRTLRFPETDADSIMEELPIASVRKGKFLYFGAGDGNPSVAESITTGETTISTFGKELIDDDDASAALDTLGFTDFGKTLIADTSAVARGTIGLDTDDAVEFAEGTFTDIITKFPYIDIRAYGAVGDGLLGSAAANATAIQAALDSLSATGGGIYIPVGHFKFGTTLDVPTGKHITIRGEGTNSFLDYTGGGAGNGIEAIGTDGSRAWITFEDFLIQGTEAMTDGIHVEWGTFKSSIERVFSQIFGGSGFYIKNSHGMVLTKCTADTGLGNGFYIESGITSLIGCIGQSVTGNGLYALSTPIQIIGGFYESNTAKEIYIDQCTGFLLSGTYTETIYDSVDSIYITGVSHSYGGSIVGCTLTRSPVTGGTAVCINLNKAHGVLIAGNYLHPHEDAAGLTGVPHIKVNSFCSDIQIGHNAFKGLDFTNPCKKVAVTDEATGIEVLNYIATLDDTGTPSVSAGNTFLTSGTTAITDFDDGTEGQVITVIAEHSLDITDGTNIFLSGSTTWSMTATDTLTLICKADNTWVEISRGDNGA